MQEWPNMVAQVPEARSRELSRGEKGVPLPHSHQHTTRSGLGEMLVVTVSPRTNADLECNQTKTL